MKKKKKITILIITVVLFLWILWGNRTVELNNITISSKDLPSVFSGYKIAQISDLHNAQFGNENAMLIRLLKEASPDIIVITGDIVDSTHTDMDTAITFVHNIVEIAPCYYITGNHEAWLGSDYNELENALIDAGVIVLHDEAVTLEEEGQTIQMIGIDDPDFSYIAADKIISTKLENTNITQEFTIMLSHRPELFDSYVENEIDLVLSGHAHGGQVRIPLIGGLIAPDQGLFPEYDAGVYSKGNTTMVVSRGIGNSVIPIRINNRPEIVLIELQSE
ncbi:MAG: metallophosphoesterase [Lachnospiraceae bacterium]|nr:metallophosphoesterase [Lachnospiraceae bacterium]